MSVWHILLAARYNRKSVMLCFSSRSPGNLVHGIMSSSNHQDILNHNLMDSTSKLLYVVAMSFNKFMIQNIWLKQYRYGSLVNLFPRPSQF